MADFLIYMLNQFESMNEEKEEYSKQLLRNYFNLHRDEYNKILYLINKIAKKHLNIYQKLIMEMRDDLLEVMDNPKNFSLYTLVKEKDLILEFSRCKNNFYWDNIIIYKRTT